MLSHEPVAPRSSRTLLTAFAALLLATGASVVIAQSQPRMSEAEAAQWKDKYARAANVANDHRTAARYCDRDLMAIALGELEQMARDARRTANAARAAGEFSTVNADSAAAFAAHMDSEVAQARARKPGNCPPEPKPVPPAPPAAQLPGAAPQVQPAQGQACPAPQPQPQAQPPSPPVESILDDIEEMERWEKEQKAKQRQQQQQQAQNPPAQGLTPADMQTIAVQTSMIESFDADIAKLKSLLEQGRVAEAHDLVDDLDDWLDWLEGRGPVIGPLRPTQRLPQELIDKWDRQIDDIIDDFESMPRLRLDLQSSTILKMHNQLRASVGLAPMAWDLQLACQAISYGPTLARYNSPVHSPRTGRETSRENLLQALPGTPVDRMIGMWTIEARYFKPGIFPDVSTTGNWADVGHFTQMAWPTTSSVGCGVQRGIGKYDWLICRYAPPGNRDGTGLWIPAPPPPPPPPPP